MLERDKFLEQQGRGKRKGMSLDERVCRLTENGRVAALGGIDPVAAWARPWDGRWRLVIFDVPEEEGRKRVKLRRVLKRLRFGYLQNSVWLSPDSLESHAETFAGARVDVESLTLFEGRPAGGESDEELVGGAWSFGLVQQRYEAWSKVASQAPRIRSGGEAAWRAMRQWAQRERAAWAAVTDCDPFLPERLLPARYNGRKYWSQRVDLLRTLAADLRQAP
ncbi:MAG: putative transcriptional regulator, PaaX family [Rariglobus sp.]|nr:putative transcriptional regulator, PaaX family [Rariglobus sp.]